MEFDKRYIIQNRDVSTLVWESEDPPVFFRSLIEALEHRDQVNASLNRDGTEGPARVVDTDGTVIEYRTEYVDQP